MRVIDLKQILNNALDELDGYDDNATIHLSPNTYGIGNIFIGTNNGYISLRNIDVEDEEDDEYLEEALVNEAKDPDDFCIKKYGVASSFRDDTWECDNFWDQIEEQGLEDAMDQHFIEVYPDGLTLTEFNDILRFSGDDVIESIGGTVEESLTGELETSKVRSESKKCGMGKRPIRESKSLQRELFEYVEEWIDEQNTNDNPRYSTESLKEYLEGNEIPYYREIAEGIINDFGAVASEQLLDALENFLKDDETPSMFSDMFTNVVERAIENVASSAEFPGY